MGWPKPPQGPWGGAATLVRLGVVWPPLMSQTLTFFFSLFLTTSGWFQPSHTGPRGGLATHIGPKRWLEPPLHLKSKKIKNLKFLSFFF
jgi:hypothetical protein